MGTVYQAEHRLMQRVVAIKVLRPELTARPEAVERFRREVMSAARLKHPHIVAALDSEQAGERQLLVMEYVDGISLDQLVARQGPLAPEEACRLLQQAAEGLAHAHEQGMIHRDIKPHNLMVTPRGELKILDFGLARLQEMSPAASLAASATAAGMVLGTPDYMSPEQIRDPRAATPQSDLYSLGCTLYFALTGEPPFATGAVIERLSAHLHTEPVPVTQHRSDVPLPLLSVLDRLLAKDPARRFASAREVSQALGALAVAATPVVAPMRTRPSARRADRRTLLLAVGGGISCITLALPATLFLPTLFGEPTVLPPSSGKRVLFVVPQQQAWYGDYALTKSHLEAAGAVVITASEAAGICEVLPDPRFPNPEPIQATVAIAEASAEDYDAIVFGGYQVSPFFGQQAYGPTVGKLLQEFRTQRKPIAAMCAGQAVLAHHHLLDGREAAGGSKLAASFPYEVPGGPIWTNQPVVVEDQGQIITGREDQFAQQFAAAVVQALEP
jgi:putative intracellular protease/amidase